MPVQKNSWAEMLEDAVAGMHRTDNKSISSFVFRNVFFLDDMLPAKEAAGYFEDIPRYQHMLQHVYRLVHEQGPDSHAKISFFKMFFDQRTF